jgi:UDPglucose 6-dehydrogenase
MRITIVGTGYVGLVTGTCFAEMGNHVTCIDIDVSKLEKLAAGIIPIHEPGLDELIKRNVDARRLDFSPSLVSSLNDSEVVFIAVGTPPNEDGSADLRHVLTVARQIGETMTRPMIVVDKSTVPVGTADKVSAEIQTALAQRNETIEFDVVSNPEFLKEGAAIKDFMSPDRIVIGTSSSTSIETMKRLYAPFSRNHDKLQFMGVRDAEMTKYAANAMLATKISFMNEIASMCEAFGVDVEQVRKGIGSDPRIGYSFIYPGAGYGGSCFPKDVRALVSMAAEANIEPLIFAAVERRNQSQKLVMGTKVRRFFKDNLAGVRIAIWGLAFKPETDDVREASALTLIEELIEAGAKVTAYDPQATETAKEALGALASSVTFADDMYSAASNADALVVMTEWKEFNQPDFGRLSSTIRSKVIFDGRNIYEPETLATFGLEYHGIGRGSYLLKDN